MSIIATALKHLIAAGVSGDDLVRAVAEMEAQAAPAAPVRTARQERNARYYQKRASEKRLNSGNQDVSDVSDASPVLSSPEGSSPTPPSPKPLQSVPPSPPKGGSSPTARQALAAVLDADRVGAVLDHRQKIRKPLTAHAAKLLAGKFSRCPDPNAAADAMIANGWQGFEPEWLERRQQPQAQSQAPPQKSAFQQRQDEIYRKLKRETGDRDDQFAGTTLDIGPGDYRPH